VEGSVVFFFFFTCQCKKKRAFPPFQWFWLGVRRKLLLGRVLHPFFFPVVNSFYSMHPSFFPFNYLFLHCKWIFFLICSIILGPPFLFFFTARIATSIFSSFFPLFSSADLSKSRSQFTLHFQHAGQPPPPPFFSAFCTVGLM